MNTEDFITTILIAVIIVLIPLGLQWIFDWSDTMTILFGVGVAVICIKHKP